MTSRPAPPTEVAPTLITDPHGLARLISERRSELGLSQSDLDDAAGWPDGYTAKLEGGYRCFGQMSLAVGLQTRGVGMGVRPVADVTVRVMVPLHE